MKKPFIAAALLLSIFLLAPDAFCQSGSVPPLTAAIWKGDAAAVAVLVAQGANVNVSRTETPLLEAIDIVPKSFNIEVVKILLGAKGIDVNKLGSRGMGSYTWTRAPLHVAAKNGNAEVVRLLLEAGAKVDIKDTTDPAPTMYGPGPFNTPLMYAAESSCPDIVKMLLDKGAAVSYQNDTGETPLMYAVWPKYAEKRTKADAIAAIQILLDSGAKVDMLAVPAKPRYQKISLPPGSPSTMSDSVLLNGPGYSALMKAANSGFIEAAGLILDKGAAIDLREFGANKHTALFFAAQRNQAEMARFLADRGANVEAVNAAGMSCLLMAAGGLYYETTEALLDKGADINAAASLPNALMYAINQGRPDKEGDSLKLIKLLLDKGIDVNYQDAQGVSPLMTACGWGVVPKSPKRARLLLEKGASLELRDKQGQTALMFAAFRGYFDIAQLLLEKGSDVNAKNAVGRDALMIASAATNDLDGRNGDFTKTVKLLLAKGADFRAMDKDKNNALSLATRYERKETIALLAAKGASLDGASLPPDQTKEIAGTWEGVRNSNPYALYRFTFNGDKTYSYSAGASKALQKEHPDQYAAMNDQLKSQASMEGGTGGTFSFREQYLVLKTNSLFVPQKVLAWQIKDGKLILNGGEYILSKVGK